MMSERLNSPNRPRGLNAQDIRCWGLIFLAVGIVGQAILWFRILGLEVGASEAEVDAVLNNNPTYGLLAFLATMVQNCAIPLFTFLLVQGAVHTGSLQKYFLRVLGVAVLSEIPYNLAYSDKWLDLNSRNPVFGLVLALAMIFLYRQYAAKSFKGIAICLMVAVVGILWVEMLRIVDGVLAIALVSVLWFARKKKGYQILMGCAVMFLCIPLSGMNSMYYYLAPLMFLMVHFYNGEPGEGKRFINYLAYPVMLTAIWAVGVYAL